MRVDRRKQWLMAGAVAAGGMLAWHRARAARVHRRLLAQGEIRPVISLRTQVGELRLHARAALPAQPPRAAPVILVHDFGLSSSYFLPTLERLGTRFMVYAPDLPGHGKSDTPPEPLDVRGLADALVSWMDAMQIGRASLVGHSMGCQIAVDATVHYPERIERLVLIGPTPDPAARSVPALLWRLLLDSAYEPPTYNLVRAKDYARMGARLFYEFRFMRWDPIEDKLPYVEAPTLLVRGAKDPLVSPRWLEHTTQLLGCAAVVVIPRYGHALTYSAAPQLVDAIAPFLQETARPLAAPAAAPGQSTLPGTSAP